VNLHTMHVPGSWMARQNMCVFQEEFKLEICILSWTLHLNFLCCKLSLRRH
jgi:hypothetical protein